MELDTTSPQIKIMTVTVRQAVIAVGIGILLGIVLVALGLVVMWPELTAAKAGRNQARHMEAFGTLAHLQYGMAEHYHRTGSYPELGSWEAMVGAGSPLVAEQMTRAGLPVNDPWGNPYEGRSTKFTFEVKCAGRPDKGLGPIAMTQDGVTGLPGVVQEP